MANTPNLANVPNELRALRRWLTWRYRRRGKRMTKSPLQSTTKPDAWLTASDARDRVVRGEADGVGFVLGDGIVCIDLDDCIDKDGMVHEIARDATALGGYVELSPSGRGWHIWIRARIPRSRNIGPRDGVPRHEIYDGRVGSARYVTVTGHGVGDVLELREGPEAQAALDAFRAKWFPEESQRAQAGAEPDGQSDTLDDDRLLQVMFSAKDGEKSRRLYDGDWSDFQSQSEADYTCIRKLRFYSRANPAQMDRLFRRSGLMRRKWDERRGEQTYGERTISQAIAVGGRVYRRSVPPYCSGASQGQFGIVHRSVYPVLSRLTKTDVLTYGALAIHANDGECYPSAARIADLVGTTREHAQASIGNLEAAGLISVRVRPGSTSIIRLPAFAGVSKFDTPREQSGRTKSSPRLRRSGRPRTFGRRAEPVSGLDTPPVSKLDTQTDKEQSIGTGERETTDSENEDPDADLKIIPFPEPCIFLRPSARVLRDEMLRGPVGQLFVDDGPACALSE